MSLNGDFADIVTYPPAKYEGIVALQVRNHPEVLPDLMARRMAFLKAAPAMEHYSGKLLVRGGLYSHSRISLRWAVGCQLLESTLARVSG